MGPALHSTNVSPIGLSLLNISEINSRSAKDATHKIWLQKIIQSIINLLPVDIQYRKWRRSERERECVWPPHRTHEPRFAIISIQFGRSGVLYCFV